MKKLTHSLTGRMSRIILSLLMAAFACSANASVVWTLNNFVFTDSTSATGSFVWNEATNTVTSWNIVTQAGVLAGSIYSPATGGTYNGGWNGLVFNRTDKPDQFRIGLADLNLLDTPSASLSLFSINHNLTGDNGFRECVNCRPDRLGLAGATLSAFSAVPEPTTIGLVGLALGLMGVARRKKA